MQIILGQFSKYVLQIQFDFHFQNLSSVQSSTCVTHKFSVQFSICVALATSNVTKKKFASQKVHMMIWDFGRRQQGTTARSTLNTSKDAL